MGRCDGCIFYKVSGCGSVYWDKPGECRSKLLTRLICPGGKCYDCLKGQPCNELAAEVKTS